MAFQVGQTAIPLSQIVGQKPYWLLDLELGGRVYHVSVDAVEVNSDGGVITYNEGLKAISIELSGDPISITLSVDSTEDWAQLVARGLDLASGRASVRRIFSGQTYEQSRVMVSGRIVDPSYGGKYEPLQFGVQTSEVEAQPVPDPTKVVDSRTWPVFIQSPPADPDPEILGSSYPIIFGKPGFGTAPLLWGTTSISQPSTPAYLAEFTKKPDYRRSKIVFAGHRVAATSVRIVDVSGGYSNNHQAPTTPQMIETLPVLHSADLLGNTVAYVDLTNAKIVKAHPGNEYWIDWGYGDGGLERPDGSGLIRGTGEVISWLLEAAKVPVARGRMAASAGILDRYKLDFAIVDPIDVESWIDDQIGGVIGIARRESTGGVWYEAIPYDARPLDVVAALEADTFGANLSGKLPVSRKGPVEYSSVSDVANEITLEYGVSRGDTYGRRKTFTGRLTAADASQTVNRLCTLSRSRYGERIMAIQCPIVSDDSTAQLILSNLAQRFALPKRTINYDGGLELEILDYNSVVTITDSELYLVDQLAIVKSVTLSLTGVSLTLELIEGAP